MGVIVASVGVSGWSEGGQCWVRRGASVSAQPWVSWQVAVGDKCGISGRYEWEGLGGVSMNK